MEKRTVAVIQARMGSFRLPGKILTNLLPGISNLEIVHERVKAASLVDHVIIATTTNPLDDATERFCKRRGIDCFRGSEEDVYGRSLAAAKACKADTIVEITADCPLVDPGHIDKLLLYMDGFDFISNSTPNRVWPDGLDINIMTLYVLEKVYKSPMVEREHVGWNIPRLAKCLNLHCYQPNDCYAKYKRPEVGITLDTPEDLIVLRAIFEAMMEKYKHLKFGVELALDWLFAHPEIMAINSHIKRKL